MKKREIYKQRMEILKQDIKNKYTNNKFLKKRLKEDGTIKIDVVLPDDFPIFDPLAPADYEIINEDIYNYIDKQIYFVPSEYDITINFIGKDLSNDEQQLIKKALQDHYNLQVYDKLDDIRRNRILGIFLLIFGSLALALYFFMTLSNNNLIILEIVSIVGTFWEAVNCWLIQGFERRQDLHNSLQMALVKVTFNDKEKG